MTSTYSENMWCRYRAGISRC